MGSSYTNIQVKTRDFDGVARCLQERVVLPVYISRPCEKGWVSVYPRITDNQDPDALRAISEMLSKEFETGVFGISVHDSNLFSYLLYENGKLSDDYESDPGYFDGEDLPPRGGNMQAVVKYCVPGTTTKELSETFGKKPSRVVGAVKFFWHLTRKDFDKAIGSTSVFRGDSLAQSFGEKLGLPRERFCVGYKYIKQGKNEIEGVTLFKNEKEELRRAQRKSGPPKLVTEAEFKRSQLDGDGRVSEHDARHGHGEHDHAHHDHAHHDHSHHDHSHHDHAKQEHSHHHQTAHQLAHGGTFQETLQIGEELNWYAAVRNVGGDWTGIKFQIEGAALAEGLFMPLLGSLERWQSASIDDSDYEEPDRDDESFWPFLFELKPTESPDVLSANVADFFFTEEFLVRLPVVPTKAGHALLKLSVEPLALEGSSSVSFEIPIEVEDADSEEPFSTEKQSGATGLKTHSLGAVSISLPEHYGVSSQAGSGLMAMMGIKHQLHAYAAPDAQFELTVQARPKKGGDEPGLRELLANERRRQRAREFHESPLETIIAGGITIELVRWKTMKLTGFVGLAHVGDDFLVTRFNTSDAAVVEDFVSALKTVVHEQ